MNTLNLDQYFSSWNEGDTGYFKIAPVALQVTENAELLEKMAKKAAINIEAEVSYAWDLGETASEAWWLHWGGYALEEEIPYYAAISMPEALEKLETFDPNDNDYECSNLEEFKEMLFAAFDEELDKDDLKRGFQHWVNSLDDKATKTLKKDLESWTEGAKNA